MNTRRTFLIAAGAGALAAQTEPPKQQLRIAIIGTGHRAWLHIEAIKLIPDFEIVALADPTPEFRDHAATIAPHAKTYSDYQKMLAEQTLDAVLVATPGGLHVDPAIAALNRGVNVICEKPMAITIADANRMIAAASKANKILQIGMQSRYSPVQQKMMELSRAGEIGPVEYICASKFRTDWNPKSWQVPDPRTGKPTIWRFLTSYTGSSLLEDGIHQMDVMHWIVNARPTRLFATGGNNVFKERETLDHAGLLMEYENGVKFAFNFSIFAPRGVNSPSDSMTVLGSEGMMQPENGKIVIRPKAGGAAKVIDVLEKTDPKSADAIRQDGTYRQYLAFRDSIRSGKQPVANGQAGKEAIKIGLLAEKSIREKRVVSWDDLGA